VDQESPTVYQLGFVVGLKGQFAGVYALFISINVFSWECASFFFFLL
jgi:hypothetical protein